MLRAEREAALASGIIRAADEMTKTLLDIKT
jgi:hypothetical protein